MEDMDNEIKKTNRYPCNRSNIFQRSHWLNTEANKVSANISAQADNFNITRKLTVLNARTDTVLLELTGTFALKNNSSNELEVIIETAEGKYQKDYVYLNDYTMYVVEDISGSEVDKYCYEINFLPEWGLKATHHE